MSSEQLPRENLIRGLYPADVGLRADDGNGVGTLSGHFAVFDKWTEINSLFEGRFLERFQAGAFKKTFQENRDGMRVLFQHGRDPQIGDKPLGSIEDLREEEEGAYYSVPLFDTAYNRELVPGLKAGVYGASFRFRVIKEELDDRPERTDHNPDGLPERTVTEAKVMEFGPVTFPAYPDATAGVRSLTDEFVVAHLLQGVTSDPDRLRAILEAAKQPEPSAATTAPTGEEEKPEPSAATTSQTRKFTDSDEWEEWLAWTSLQG